MGVVENEVDEVVVDEAEVSLGFIIYRWLEGWARVVRGAEGGQDPWMRGLAKLQAVPPYPVSTP